MYLKVIIIYLITSSFVLCSAFFLFKAKEPIWFCYKVCPLYCPNLLHQHSNRRQDDDAASLSYVDDVYPPYGHHEDHKTYDEEPGPRIYEYSGHKPYLDHEPHVDFDDKIHSGHRHHGWHHHRHTNAYEIEYSLKYVFKPVGPTTKMEPKPTTTMAPTTTPKELTGICVACLKKCQYYWHGKK